MLAHPSASVAFVPLLIAAILSGAMFAPPTLAQDAPDTAPVSEVAQSDSTQPPQSTDTSRPEVPEQSEPGDAAVDEKSATASDEPTQSAKEKAKANNQSKKEAPDAPRRLPNFGSLTLPMLPGQPWRVHDLNRPRPPMVTPGTPSTYDQPGTAPSDAIVLFDGVDLSQWAHTGPDGPDQLIEPKWKVENGYFEVVPRTGTLRTIDSFGSCQLHLEWQAPAEVKGDSQGRGNSGIHFMQEYEIQILDSYNSRTYADGQAGAMYGQYPPMVNASRPPGEWQIYDIIFEAPEFSLSGELEKPAFVTVLHNGVLLHHRRQYYGPSGGRVVPKYSKQSPAAPITLQDHGNPVRFRNIWIRPLVLD